jgi:hypothetical protein
MSRKLLAAGLVAVVVVAGCGGGGGGDKPKPATHAKPSTALSVDAYTKRVQQVMYKTRPAGSRMAHARTTRGIIESARGLAASWTNAANTLDGLPARPSAMKFQDQIVAAFRNGAAKLRQELATPHPDRARLGDVFSSVSAKTDPLFESLFAAP